MDRLTAQDLMLLWPEELGWSQDIGALAILDGTSLLDGDGRFRIERAREEIGRALQERAWELGAKLVAGAPTAAGRTGHLAASVPLESAAGDHRSSSRGSRTTARPPGG